MKAIVRFIILALSVGVISGGALGLDFLKRADLVVPRTVLGDINLAGMSREQTREVLEKRFQQFKTEPFKLVARGDAKTVTFEEIGVEPDGFSILSEMPFAGSMSNIEILLRSFAGQRIMPSANIVRPQLLRLIEEKFPEIPKAKNAFFSDGMKIVAEKPGLSPKIEELSQQIGRLVGFLEHQPIFIEFEEVAPTVVAADLERHKNLILNNFPSTIALSYDKKKWEVDFKKHPSWIIFEKKSYSVAEGELPFFMRWDPVAFAGFVSKSLAPAVEQTAEGVRIWSEDEPSAASLDGSHKPRIYFEGRGVSGQRIEQEQLLVLVNDEIETKGTEVGIPVSVVQPKIEVSPDLQALGIVELIGVGHTRFAGSPSNRAHNIGVGIARFNGVLVAPGETFSFNEHLGQVDASTGYRKELVIKPEGTIPEFGGGLCQVSSTMYRAAIYTGLPVVERWSHSYAVTYYAQVGGHGLDATIYPPSRDLKFANDTPGHILIQSYVDGVSAYIKFYGTQDGREVVMDGPYISNRRGPPNEPIFVPDFSLKPGEKKQVEKPHGGFDTLWYRYITKNGDTQKETIVSKYKAVPAKFLVGGEITAEGEIKGLTEEAAPAAPALPAPSFVEGSLPNGPALSLPNGPALSLPNGPAQ